MKILIINYKSIINSSITEEAIIIDVEFCGYSYESQDFCIPVVAKNWMDFTGMNFFIYGKLELNYISSDDLHVYQ